MRWSRQIGSARNKSDSNKTRDGEERREGKKRVTNSGYYLPPPSSVIIKEALSPPPYINTIPPPPGTQEGGETLVFFKKKREKLLNLFKVKFETVVQNTKTKSALSEVCYLCAETQPVQCSDPTQKQKLRVICQELFVLGLGRWLFYTVCSRCFCLSVAEKHLIHFERQKG